ncbi:phosphotransferase [Aestuariirhabdus sp. Z084]|uniref:aminoglycoside phosphotransferase family protein n=1 Tax=Aestuariirhabdus haliotis TaxID=2918751 RepID=UPI00201B3E36|nr:phosphotransferase [Aestuariirhabdus haliotis]MCL6415556.1 phosphotransferase [Aestuariirhabdus haliotis]MCL6419239.1 phosphotransferase [Aestuariirhabdus haliotis]
MQGQDRQQARNQFIAQHGWGKADVQVLAADASFRCYFRLHQGTSGCLLMDAPPPQEDIRPFIQIANHLIRLGFRAPRVFDSDVEQGFALLEDFGDETFSRLLSKGESEAALYSMAVELLIRLHNNPDSHQIELPEYDHQALLHEALLLVQWYYPALAGTPCPQEAVEQYREAWLDCFALLEGQAPALVLRDFHVDNLMRIEGEGEGAECGLLDFQDALLGNAAYDLMSLLEDARRDVTPQLQTRLLEQYLAARPELDAKQFMSSYRVLAAQRHAKVAGIFVRLMVRDGKSVYLQHIPRVVALLMRNLQSDELLPVRNWFQQWLPQMGQPLDLTA